MNVLVRGIALAAAGIVSMLAATQSVTAEEPWPSRPIRIVVPSAAGGYDVYARLMAPKLSERLGQPVFIENRAGVNGNIGMSEVQRSIPDGHTLLFAASGALTINASVFRSMPLDTVEDLTPIARPVTVPMIWVTHPGSRFHRLQDVIDQARANPGKVDYANPGTGSLNHLLIEAFKQRHKLDMVPIPFNGTPAAQNEVVAGRIPLMIDSLGAGMGHIEGNRVRVLAVTTRERATALPNVASVIEQGLEEREYVGWYAFLAPKGTPPHVIARLNAAVNEIIADAEISGRVLKLGAQPRRSTPEELRATMITERDIWRKVAHTAGLEPK
jgi:tripartite-type tricarboxylate transporter receptor subunit TctC